MFSPAYNSPCLAETSASDHSRTFGAIQISSQKSVPSVPATCPPVPDVLMSARVPVVLALLTWKAICGAHPQLIARSLFFEPAFLPRIC